MTMYAADDRAYLSAQRANRYALGDPDNPTLTLNDADDQGCLWIAEDTGWDAPEVITPMDRRPSGHGGYAGEPTFEPRTIALEGTVTAPSGEALDAAHDRWLNAVLGNLTAYRYAHLDETPRRGLWVLPAGQPKWRALDDRVADFAFTLLAEDPIKTGDTATYGPIRLPSATGEGGYPMDAAGGALMPWTSTGGAVGATVVTVANDGDQDAHALYVVTGPVPQPRIQLGNGQYAQLAADLGALDTWQVDTAAGTSTVNGVNRYDAWAAGSTFPLIPPGGVELRFRSNGGGTDPAAGLLAYTAPSWK